MNCRFFDVCKKGRLAMSFEDMLEQDRIDDNSFGHFAEKFTYYVFDASAVEIRVCGSQIRK